MEAFLYRHTHFWKDKTIMLHTLLSVVLLCISLYLIYYARIYTSDYLDNVVPDLLLDHIPIVSVGYIFFQGAFMFLLALIGILVWDPKYIPFTLETTALFFFARSFFMVMTHLSAPATEYYKYVEHEHHVRNVLFTISSGNDLFFSGHAGFPFLLALVFWQQKHLRLLFLLCSLIGSVAVIVGHLHYSIDVFSAYFIAFGIFEMSKFFFKKEYSLLGLPAK
jgi:hypothetical protein